MNRILAHLSWPFVALVAIGAAVFIVVALWAPPDVKQWILGPTGLLAAIVGYYLESPRSRSVRLSEVPPGDPPPLSVQPPPDGASS
jgi:hypothetical protein